MLSQDAKLLLSKHPELIREITEQYHLLNYSTGFKLNINLCWPGFVQKHTEPKRDWEIVAISDGGRIIEADKTGRFRYAAWSEYTIEHAIEIGFKIHSVKRLSDGEVFSVGDDIYCKAYNFNGKIKSFEINGNDMMSSVNTGINKFNLILFQKYRIPLFTTSDGKPVYEGDLFYWVGKQWVAEKSRAVFGAYATEHKKFSTHQSASDYVLMNRPCLSISDLKELVWSGVTGDWYLDKLKELAKQKSAVK